MTTTKNILFWMAFFLPLKIKISYFQRLKYYF
jgi:hypothetical protein